MDWKEKKKQNEESKEYTSQSYKWMKQSYWMEKLEIR